MKYSLSGTVCALALFCASVPVATLSLAAPAQAQSMQVSFDAFHDELARYGDWVFSDRWGPVWLPNAGPDYRPYYSNGYWANTDDYGSTWVSDDPWGEITFHYGRWVDDPDDGWMWISGYVWSPAWVVWRSNDDAMGWMPMPPDRDFLSGGGDLNFAASFNDPDDDYGYRTWYGRDFTDDRFARMWVFVNFDHFGDRDFRRYAQPANNFAFIRNARNVTNYTVVNNIVVNRSVDQHRIERAGGRFAPVRAAQVLHNPGRITGVAEGRREQQAMRARIPQGSGAVKSAPRPTEAVASGLTDRMPSRRGGDAGHLQTRQQVQQAGFADRPPSMDARRDRVREQQPAAAPAAQAPQLRQEQERLAQQRQQQDQQDRTRADRQRQDQERVAQQSQQQEQARAQQQQQRQQQEQARVQQTQQRQQQEQARAQQTQQRQQQDQARAQQQQQRQQQDQARAQQAQQRQQQEQARAQQPQQRPQEQARGQQQPRPPEQQARRQQHEEQRAQQTDEPPQGRRDREDR